MRAGRGVCEPAEMPVYPPGASELVQRQELR